MRNAPLRRPDARLIATLPLLLPCVAHAAGAEAVDGVMAAAAPGTFTLVARALGSLAAVVALIAALALLLRRLREHAPARGAARSLHAIERLDLGGKRELRVVRAGDRMLVLGVTEQRIDLLTELDGAAETAAEAAPDHGAANAAAAGAGTPGLRLLRKLATSA